MKLSELASSFRCNKFENYICKNANLNTKTAEIKQTNNKFIKRPPNYICMPNLKKDQIVPSMFLRADKVPNEINKWIVKRLHAVQSTASWTRSEGLWKGPVFPFTATVTWYWCMMCLFDFLPALLFMYIRQVTQVSDVPVVAARNGRRWCIWTIIQV